MLWTTQSYGWYKQLGIPWAQASRCYEQLKAKDDINISWSWAYNFKWYEQLGIVDDMNNSNLLAQATIVMHSSGLSLAWMILSCELRTIDAMKSS